MSKSHNVMPYLLLRESPRNFTEFSKLQCEKSLSMINEAYKKQIRSLILKEEIISLLFQDISKQHDNKYKFFLIQVRRDIYNSRVQKIDLLRIKNNKIQRKIKQYIKMHRVINNIEKKYCETFDKEIKLKNNYLKKLIKNKDYQSGLLLSSISLFENQSNSDTSSSVGLMKYLSRMYAKTSPYSTLTRTTLIHSSLKYYKKNTIIRLNVVLLKYLKEAFLNCNKIKHQSIININSTFSKSEDSYSFFAVLDKEYFRKISTATITDYIWYQLTNNARNTFTYSKFITQLITKIKLPQRKIEKYLNKLIEYGFIEIDLGVSLIDPKWDEHVLKQLKKKELKKDFHQIIPLMQDLVSIKKSYSSSTIQKRRELVKESTLIIQKLSKLVTKDPELANKITSVNPILFEDVIYESNKTPPLNQSLINALSNFSFFLQEDDLFSTERTNLKLYFLKHFGTKSSVTLLELYKSYQSDDSNIYNQQKSQSNTYFSNIFKKNISNKELPDTINFNLEQLETSKNHKKQLLSAALQPFQTEEGEFFVLNYYAPGYGRSIARFLSKANTQCINEIISMNNKYLEDSLIVENIDTTYKNTNMHPAIAQYQLALPNLFLKDKNKKVFLNEIVVRYDAQKDELILFHAKNKRKISLVNLSLTSIEARQSVFKFLTLFSPQRYLSTRNIFTFINNTYQNNNTINYIPRIIIDNVLVVQRKKWFFKKDSLPIPKKGESIDRYFYKVNIWRLEQLLPDEIFVKNTNSGKNVDEKPQYINFKIPLLTEIFKKIVTQSEAIEIEEMLPNSQNMKFKQTTEYIIEFN